MGRQCGSSIECRGTRSCLTKATRGLLVVGDDLRLSTLFKERAICFLGVTEMPLFLLPFYLFREWISANQDGLMLPCPLPEAKTPLWRQRYQLSWYSTLCDIECWHHGFGAKKPAGSRSCGTDPDHIWLMLVWSCFGCTFGRCFTYLNVSINQILSLVDKR